MDRSPAFNERVAAAIGRLSPSEQRVVRFFQENREEVLVASASALASKARTSDATVIRTAKALGYSGLDDMRRALAVELRLDLSLPARLARTLSEVGGRPETAFDLTLDTHLKAIEGLRRDISGDLFNAVVSGAVKARRIFIFGIGPSSAIAEYFTIQLVRFGIDARPLTQTGLLLADGLLRIERDDLVIMLAYGRIYQELEVLLTRAAQCGIATVLLTDTLAMALRERVDIILPVARGRADMFSMHTATLALIEALLVGIAATRQTKAVASLKLLNELRTRLVGRPMDLPTSNSSPKPIASKKENGRPRPRRR